jgi:hypothetical protein
MVLRLCVVALTALVGACGSGGGAGPSSDVARPVAGSDPSGSTGGEAASPPAAAQGDGAPAAADGNFAIQAVAHPPFAVGGQARAEVSLEARNGYHVNQEYPIELRVQAPAGVELAKARLARADASTFDEARAVFPVVFTPREAGHEEFTGELRFSVCNAQNCLLERRPVTFAVDVP